jgi:hypothetical protein
MSLISKPARVIPTTVDGTLLDTQTTNTNGTWFYLGPVAPWSFTTRGVFNGCTITVYASNQVTKPLDSDSNQAQIQTFTAPGSGGQNFGFRWVKAAVTAAGGSTSVSVDVMGPAGPPPGVI